jgi:hypothetical protein
MINIMIFKCSRSFLVPFCLVYLTNIFSAKCDTTTKEQFLLTLNSQVPKFVANNEFISDKLLSITSSCKIESITANKPGGGQELKEVSSSDNIKLIKALDGSIKYSIITKNEKTSVGTYLIIHDIGNDLFGFNRSVLQYVNSISKKNQILPQEIIIKAGGVMGENNLIKSGLFFEPGYILKEEIFKTLNSVKPNETVDYLLKFYGNLIYLYWATEYTDADISVNTYVKFNVKYNQGTYSLVNAEKIVKYKHKDVKNIAYMQTIYSSESGDFPLFSRLIPKKACYMEFATGKLVRRYEVEVKDVSLIDFDNAYFELRNIDKGSRIVDNINNIQYTASKDINELVLDIGNSIKSP